VELINLPGILHNPVLAETLPSIPNKLEVPTIIYELETPIGPKCFNFNKFVNSLDVDRLLSDED
jgi:hypothetical protein